jgi:Holliday junction DNA helicase RuvB
MARPRKFKSDDDAPVPLAPPADDRAMGDGTTLAPERAFTPDVTSPDEDRAEASLRPQTFDEFVGQRQTIQNLRIYLQAAREREEPMDHILFFDLPGLGKTTLAQIIANEMQVPLRITSGPALTKAADLVGLLTRLEEREVLFIDEIHRLAKPIQEYLFPAMEDFAVDILLDQGPHARSVRLDLKPFTLVCATTRWGNLAAPFRSRFGILERLEPYPPEDLATIARRTAGILDTPIDDSSVNRIATVSRGTPRIANRFVRRIRDVAQVRKAKGISPEVCDEGLRMLGVDERGLDRVDRSILQALANAGPNGALGLKTLSIAVGEDEETLEDVYEPFLIQQGYIAKTPRGRALTANGAERLGLDPRRWGGGMDGQGRLF